MGGLMSYVKSGSDMVNNMSKLQMKKVQKKMTTQFDLIIICVDYFPTAYIKTNSMPYMTKY